MFEVGARVTHRAKHADRMRGTVEKMSDDGHDVFVIHDSDGHIGVYMVVELKREGVVGTKAGQ